jgi:Protein of unknown function (DUF3489)
MIEMIMSGSGAQPGDGGLFGRDRQTGPETKIMSNVNLKTSKLTDTQLVMLSKAAQREDMLVEVPSHLRGSAVSKVLAALEGRGLITVMASAERERINDGPDRYILTSAAFAALGLAQPAAVAEQADDSELRAGSSVDDASAVAASAELGSAAGAAAHEASTKAPRSGTKLASVMTALDRPEGASLADLMELTGWLPHTTRAALTGLRHRDLMIDRSRNTEGVTIYRLLRPLPPADTGIPDDERAEAA